MVSSSCPRRCRKAGCLNHVRELLIGLAVAATASQVVASAGRLGSSSPSSQASAPRSLTRHERRQTTGITSLPPAQRRAATRTDLHSLTRSSRRSSSHTNKRSRKCSGSRQAASRAPPAARSRFPRSMRTWLSCSGVCNEQRTRTSVDYEADEDRRPTGAGSQPARGPGPTSDSRSRIPGRAPDEEPRPLRVELTLLSRPF